MAINVKPLGDRVLVQPLGKAMRCSRGKSTWTFNHWAWSRASRSVIARNLLRSKLTIGPCATGDVVRRLQRALRRTLNLRSFSDNRVRAGEVLEHCCHRFLEAARSKAKGASRGFTEAGS